MLKAEDLSLRFFVGGVGHAMRKTEARERRKFSADVIKFPLDVPAGCRASSQPLLHSHKV